MIIGKMHPTLLNRRSINLYLVNLIDVKDKHGRCPLHCAALFANVEAVKTLIKANANPDQEWKLRLFYMVNIESNSPWVASRSKGNL